MPGGGVDGEGGEVAVGGEFRVADGDWVRTGSDFLALATIVVAAACLAPVEVRGDLGACATVVMATAGSTPDEG